LARFHGNERGAEEGANKLLIFALIALPILAVLIFFGREIVDLAKEAYNRVTGGDQIETP